MSSILARTINGIQSSQFDPDAIAFLSAAGIAGATDRYAINNLVTGLKINGLWNKMQAIYPFAGTTATTQKFNLKNPADTDAAFRLVFNGGWTHSSTGATPNGTNAYADTKYIGSTSSNLDSAHVSVYSRTNGAGGFQVELGGSNVPGEQRMLIITRWVTNTVIIDLFSANQRFTIASPPTTGLFVATRNAAADLDVYRNGSLLGTNTSADPLAALPTVSQFLGGFNNNGTPANFSVKQLAFATIGSKLETTTENTNFYTVVQAYQTALSRQV